MQGVHMIIFFVMRFVGAHWRSKDFEYILLFSAGITWFL